ncbi:hypothetical protein [Jonesia quinghaiensis]|uniref:hypothetical protein n=1 Tax=Jonesia quinghaiensis TaxID=262806 RepID=UPI0006877D66|nr:hypothetical protein [Jonesia quinghaiensis]
MRFSSKIVTTTVLAAIMAISPISAFASTDPGNLGGWSEDDGYFANQQPSGGISPLAATGTPRHTGKAEGKVINGTSHKRAHGWTTWKGVRHYTRAQLTGYWPNADRIIADSGRVWGRDGTEAVTKWVAFNPNDPDSGNGKAKTFYGK